MGMFGKCITEYVIINNNPNPENYTILKYKEIGSCIVLKVNYPDCKNYEGNKILVYDNITMIQIINAKELDPHFGGQKIAPVARFEPTENGWDNAVAFANLLNDRQKGKK